MLPLGCSPISKSIYNPYYKIIESFLRIFKIKFWGSNFDENYRSALKNYFRINNSDSLFVGTNERTWLNYQKRRFGKVLSVIQSFLKSCLSGLQPCNDTIRKFRHYRISDIACYIYKFLIRILLRHKWSFVL